MAFLIEGKSLFGFGEREDLRLVFIGKKNESICDEASQVFPWIHSHMENKTLVEKMNHFERLIN
jgi:hypothetical protein